jgi:hypothetical protein
MKAALLFHDKRVEADGTIIEMTIWRLAEPVPPSVHRLKYSLFYGRSGQRIVGFDNERGKGDHLHVDGEERPYAFTTVAQLMRDFFAEVARAENGK